MAADFRNILLRPYRASQTHYKACTFCWSGRALFPPSLEVLAFSRIDPLLQPTLQLHTSLSGGGRKEQPSWSRGRTKARRSPPLPGAAWAHARLVWPHLRTLSFQGGKFSILLGKYRSRPILLQQ